MFPGKHHIITLFTYINGKHGNRNADHVVLIEQRDWSVSYAYVTNLIVAFWIRGNRESEFFFKITKLRNFVFQIHSSFNFEDTKTSGGATGGFGWVQTHPLSKKAPM